MSAATSTHVCSPPLRPASVRYPALRVDGGVGDLWRCGQCQRLWLVELDLPALKTPDALRWRPAGAWDRFWHRRFR